MDLQIEKMLSDLAGQFIAYLPSLIGGVVLVGIGLLLGWLSKRLSVQLALVLRLDRLFRRFRWGVGFAKGDIRYAFYNSLGNIVFILVFLVLLTASLDVLRLTILSEMIRSGVLFVPKLIIALVIVGLGWMVAGWSAGAIQRALVKEEMPRATLIARFARAVIMLFFSAMALTELDVARDIVVIGFSAAIVTLGLIVVVLAVIGGKSVLLRLERGDEKMT